MCLIIYSPTGDLLERPVFEDARLGNPHGIGIMSRRGVQKFLGRTAGRRAWQCLRQLSESHIPYGIHFRWATHGDVTRGNCHPFYAPKSDAIVMHNGVLHTAEDSTPSQSDTSLFVEKLMAFAPGPESQMYSQYYHLLSMAIGRSNMFLILHTLTGEFTICNESSGEWIGQHWYSNPFFIPGYIGDASWGAFDPEHW